ETPLERGIMREARRHRDGLAETRDGREQLVTLLTRRLCEAGFARPAARHDALLATTRFTWPVETEAV
ncbi:MAG TPA: hypothetical protein VML55_07155, partial [Planctomycetaceae bacterium]|nr:hypothetical protein [Planctomycetaceae bacterium]